MISQPKLNPAFLLIIYTVLKWVRGFWFLKNSVICICSNVIISASKKNKNICTYAVANAYKVKYSPEGYTKEVQPQILTQLSMTSEFGFFERFISNDKSGQNGDLYLRKRQRVYLEPRRFGCANGEAGKIWRDIDRLEKQCKNAINKLFKNIQKGERVFKYLQTIFSDLAVLELKISIDKPHSLSQLLSNLAWLGYVANQCQQTNLSSIEEDILREVRWNKQRSQYLEQISAKQTNLVCSSLQNCLCLGPMKRKNKTYQLKRSLAREEIPPNFLC